MNALLISALSAPVEALLNLVLSQDPVAANRLSRYDGKRVRMTCTSPLRWEMWLQVQGGRVRLKGTDDGPEDAGIAADASAFVRLLLSDRQTDALFSPDIMIAGDSHTLQALHEILGGLQIDWEEHLSRIFGDVPAYELGRMASKGREWTRRTTTSLVDDVEEYLHEEARLLPSRSEFSRFSSRMDDVLLSVDRIEARLQRLRHRIEGL